MKTTLLLAIICSLFVSACDRESAYEILEPVKEKEILNTYPISPDQSGLSSLEDHLSEAGDTRNGLQDIQVLKTASLQEELHFTGAEQIIQFYLDFPILESDHSIPEESIGINQQDTSIYRHRLGSIVSNQRICPNPKYESNMDQEIKRLQKIATTHCLNLAVTFLTCNGANLEEIGVFITPGVACQALAASTSGSNEKQTSLYFLTH